MSKPATITIDGPAASGKSTVGALLARSLGYFYFDTGVMYRAVTWAALARNIDVENIEEVSRLAEGLTIDVTADGPEDGRQYTVWVDRQDVTWLIRSPKVDAAVSRVSSYPRVRAALTAQQRRIASDGFIVMVGRDLGTVVLPDAHLKIYLVASPQERARRRYRDCLARGDITDFNEILAGILKRDQQDQRNPVSPMVPAHDAIIIDTDNQSVEAVVARLEKLAVQYKNGST